MMNDVINLSCCDVLCVGVMMVLLVFVGIVMLVQVVEWNKVVFVVKGVNDVFK